MSNLIKDEKIRKEAMLAWRGVKSREEVVNWHKLYTPWFTDQEIEGILKLYDIKLLNPEPEDILPDLSTFEKYMLISR